MNLEELCEEYFKGKVKPKHLSQFEETTPKGNTIQGYINHKPNKYLGSLLITNVNGEECIQFIHSMPKIHYYNDSRDIPITENIYYCFEKLDGTCLILYPLKNSKGEIIEVVPKTRGRAVADSHFIELYNKVDKKSINDYYKENSGVLLFELYGILNQHDIIYYDTGVDIRLIAIVDDDGNYINNPIDYTDYTYTDIMKYGFKLPDPVCVLYHRGTEWYIESRSQKYYPYLKSKILNYPTIDDAVDGLMELLETLNKEFFEVNGRIAIEGVVINVITKCGYKRFLKCKPHDIMIKHTTENGIPRKSITKEVLKYFDEYGSTVADIYNDDPNHHTEYLYRMLEEEYPIELIHRSKNKIEKIFMQIWDNKQIPESIHKICDDLIRDYPNQSVSDLMRVFAKKYPMKKKKDARLVFTVLEKQLKRKEQIGG